MIDINNHRKSFNNTEFLFHYHIPRQLHIYIEKNISKQFSINLNIDEFDLKLMNIIKNI